MKERVNSSGGSGVEKRLRMWRRDDDGVDDSPLVGNQREERIIIKQLNYSAISPRQRQPRQGSALKLIWEAWRHLEDQRATQWRGKTPPLEDGKEEEAGGDGRGEEERGACGGRRGPGSHQREKRLAAWRRPGEDRQDVNAVLMKSNTCKIMSMSSVAGPDTTQHEY